MRSITLYHGTSAPINTILDQAKMNNAHNGVGFYMTDSIDLARKYGMNIVKFEVFDLNSLNLDIQPIDRECADSATEYVIRTNADLNNLLDEEHSDNSGV